MKNKNIIVNADDFGARSSINKAIIELFNSGLVNSTTIMANMPAFEEAIELSHKNKVTDKVGVHLVLTEGAPLTKSIRDLSYLFNKNNSSRSLLVKKLFLLNKTDKNLIFKEYSRQIDKVKKEGILVTHVDTHQHMHDMWGIMQIMVELLKVYDIPSMRILNNLETTAYHKYAYRNFANNYLKVKKVNFTDCFGSRVDFLLALKRYPNLAGNKKVEIMVHPDYNSQGTIIDQFPNREYDFNFLNKLNYN